MKLTDAEKKSLAELSNKLGCVFHRPELLRLALVHRSVHGQKNNERLEFLGDAVLNIIAAEMLYHRFEKAKEGQMSRMRAELVSGVALAKIAKKFQLGDYLVLSPGELKSGGHRRDSILADAFEAVVGALYLDQGIDICRQQVLVWFDDAVQALKLNISKDPKTRLQEKLQAYKKPLPDYIVHSVEGHAHDQHFKMICRVPGIDHETFGEGATRRSAEQQAAEHYWAWLEEQDLGKK